MLKSLSVENLALAKSSTMEFGQGFCVLTGETGAGKSMLVDALGLVLGARADTQLVRSGSSKATVSAVFEASKEAAAWVALRGIEVQEDEICLRRSIEAEGRSRAWVNGVGVSISELRELGGMLASIHGQNDSMQLLTPKGQKLQLDEFCGNSELLESVGRAYRDHQKAAEALDQARLRKDSLEREKSQWAWVCDEIGKAAPRDGEWELVEQEFEQLSRGSEISKACQEACECLRDGEDAVSARLSRLARMLGALPGEAVKQAAQSIGQAAEICEEAGRELSRAMERQDCSPERQAAVESRMAQLHSTAKKMRCEPALLPAKLLEAQSMLASLERGLDLAALEAVERSAVEALLDACRALSVKRRDGAQRLSKLASQNLAKLGMGKSRVDAVVAPKAPGPDGSDEVEFFLTHDSQQGMPLSKCASGGELSRIGLAMAAASRSGMPPCMVFDEVDAGVGGPTAEKVGQMLSEIGQGGQALAVTHLPQVACKASRHYVVEKSLAGGSSSSRVFIVQGAPRVKEVARMLGSDSSSSALAHAKSLLEGAP